MERLKKVQFFVEASSNEKFNLWKEYNEEINWETDNMGFGITVGHIKSGREKLPVCVQFNFATIGNKYICFYYPTSRGVDWNLVEKFIKKNYPVKYDNGTRLAMTDAGNFHNCFHFCQEETKTSLVQK